MSALAEAGLVNFNLRFPGQYYDQETGLNYNYRRDGYDSATGRYTQSDPIGLKGGLNTYLYADANPLSIIDPLGLMGFGGYPSNVPIARPSTNICETCGPGDKLALKIENTPCVQGDAMCGIALQNAGFAPPYYPHTVVLSKKCLATLGIVGKTVAYKGTDAITKKGVPAGARLLGASEEVAVSLGKNVSEVLGPGMSALLILMYGIDEITEKCECKNGK
jgi:RHS repeat-associated protein